MLPALRNVPKKKKKVEKVLGRFKTHSITKTNELFHPGAVVATSRLGVTRNKEAGIKEPM